MARRSLFPSGDASPRAFSNSMECCGPPPIPTRSRSTKSLRSPPRITPPTCPPKTSRATATKNLSVARCRLAIRGAGVRQRPNIHSTAKDLHVPWGLPSLPHHDDQQMVQRCFPLLHLETGGRIQPRCLPEDAHSHVSQAHPQLLLPNSFPPRSQTTQPS